MHLPGKSTEVRNVMRSEDITEPKDVIPTGRMARVIARRQWESGRVRTCSIMFSYDMRLYSTPFYYCTFILLYYITTKVHYIYIYSFIARPAVLSAIHLHCPPGSCRRLAQMGSTWPTPSPRDSNKTSMAWWKGPLAAKVPWLDGHHTAICWRN